MPTGRLYKIDPYVRDPKTAQQVAEGEEADAAEALSFHLHIDSLVLREPPDGRRALESERTRARVLRAWRAYHAGDDLTEQKQKQLVRMLNELPKDLAFIFDDVNVTPAMRADIMLASLRFRLRFVDKPLVDKIDDATFDRAIESWPPRRGRPRKASGNQTDWDRVNDLFSALGCGFPEGQALREHLSKAGIYSAKKRG